MINSRLITCLKGLSLCFVVALCLSQSLCAQVTLTKPTLSFGACSFPSNYHPLGNITINESVRDDFSTAGPSPKTIELSAPTHFEFRPGTGFATVNFGGNLAIVSFNCTETSIIIEYDCIQVNKNDKMTIIGLEIRAINEASSGNITRTGGTGIVNGFLNGETLTTLMSSNDLSGSPNYYSTVSYRSGHLLWSDPSVWDCGVVPPNDGSAIIFTKAYQGSYSTDNCLIFDQDADVLSLEIEGNANLSPGVGGGKILVIQDDFIIQSSASLRNKNWTSNGTNTIQIGGDFTNNGFMSTDGGNNPYNMVIEMIGTSPQIISGSGSFKMIGSGNEESSLVINSIADVTLASTFRTNDDNGTPGKVIINGTLRFLNESIVLNGVGELELNGYTELKAGAFNDHFQLSGSQQINLSSSIEYTNTVSSISLINTPTATFGSLINNVSASGNLTVIDNIIITGTLTMQSGIISTNSVTISIGSSTSNIGSLNYQSGFIHGVLKRWFSGTNSGNSSGLYPISKNGTQKRFMKVEYTEATDGGSLKAEWINTEMGYNLNGDTITTNCNGSFLIENTDNGYWEMTPNDGITTSENKTYNITLEAEGIISLIDACHITTIKRVDPNPWEVSGIHVDNTGNLINPIIKRLNATGWSNWGFAGGVGVPLPVELSNFNSNCLDNHVEVSWITQSEYNSSHFELLKSRDGFSWDVIQTQPAAGFSNSEITYSYFDESVHDCYYKLVQYDIDGQNEHFGPIHSGCSDQNSYITTFPNPSTNSFNLIINDSKFLGETNVEYFNCHGEIIADDLLTLKDGINLFVIDASAFNNGVYLIRISNGANFKVLKHLIE